MNKQSHPKHCKPNKVNIVHYCYKMYIVYEENLYYFVDMCFFRI